MTSSEQGRLRACVATAGHWPLASAWRRSESRARLSPTAFAQPGQITFEPKRLRRSPHEMHWFHNDLLVPIIIVDLALRCRAPRSTSPSRFNEKANPVPSKTTHNTVLEIAWTIIPVLILFVIAIPSMKLLTHELVVPKSDMTLQGDRASSGSGPMSIRRTRTAASPSIRTFVKGDDFKPGHDPPAGGRQRGRSSRSARSVHLLVTERRRHPQLHRSRRSGCVSMPSPAA